MGTTLLLFAGMNTLLAMGADRPVDLRLKNGKVGLVFAGYGDAGLDLRQLTYDTRAPEQTEPAAEAA